MVCDFSNEVYLDCCVEFIFIIIDIFNFWIDEMVLGNDEFNIDGEFFFYYDVLISDNVDIEIWKGESEGFVLEEWLEFWGINLVMAEEFVVVINYQEWVMVDVLIVLIYFYILCGIKWCVQGVWVIVEILVGKFICFDGEICFYIDDVDKVNYCFCIYDNFGSIW